MARKLARYEDRGLLGEGATGQVRRVWDASLARTLAMKILLRAHDRGRHAAWLRGDGALTLVTDPPGAEAVLYRYVERQRRLVPELVRSLGVTPIFEVPPRRGELAGHLAPRRPPRRPLPRRDRAAPAPGRRPSRGRRAVGRSHPRGARPR